MMKPWPWKKDTSLRGIPACGVQAKPGLGCLRDSKKGNASAAAPPIKKRRRPRRATS
jgi:hypothetical protein